MIIGFPHRAPSKGGPGSFQSRFEVALKNRGWTIVYPNDKIEPDIIMVVGGTKKLFWLFKQKFRGVPIIYRLDGINWLHKKTRVSKKKWIVNESRNILIQFIRSFMAAHIVYQSRFVKDWWESEGWFTNAGSCIIWNGVNLREFSPKKSSDQISLLCLEGTIDYSPYAVQLLNELQEKLAESTDLESLILYGGFDSNGNKSNLQSNIDYRGLVSRDQVPELYKNAIYLSLDVNAACPNTVVESLASGIPVIGFDTGALKELVTEKGGVIISYGSDPWELDFPDVDALYKAALHVRKDWDRYSQQARELAEARFDIDIVIEKYIKVIENTANK